MLTRRHLLQCLPAAIAGLFVTRLPRADAGSTRRVIHGMYNAARQATEFAAVDIHPKGSTVTMLRRIPDGEPVDVNKLIDTLSACGRPDPVVPCQGSMCFFDTPANRAAILAA